MLVVWTILAIVGVLVALVVIVVATPMHLRLLADAGDGFDLRAEIRTFWGLSPPLRLEGDRHAARVAGVLRKPRKRKPERRSAHEVDEDDDTGVGVSEVMRLLRAVPDAAMTALRRIHLDRLRLRAVFGFADPADTGQVFGQLTPLVYGVPCARCEVQIEPDFDGPRFEGSADVSIHLTPLAVAWPILRLVLVLRRAEE